MFVGASALAAFAFIPIVTAGGYLMGLLQALNTSGLDQLANTITSLNGTTVDQYVLTQLAQGNKTIFAPTDSACVSLLKDHLFFLQCCQCPV